MVVDDSRNVNQPQTHFLSPSMAAVYRLTRDPCTFNQMMVQLDAEGHGNLGAEQVRRCLEDLSAVDLVIKERETYLGLALSQD